MYKRRREEMPTRASTGIDRIDKLTQGGFLRGKTYLVSGSPGSGKSILALQFVLSGLDQDEKAVYISVNEKPDDLVVTADSLNWNLETPIADEKLQLLDMSPFFSRFAVKSYNKFEPRPQDVNVRKLLVELGKHTRAVGASRVVIDSINSIIPYASEAEAIAFSRELVFSLEEHLACTTLLTYDRWDGLDMFATNSLESYACGVLELDVSFELDVPRRSLALKKFRATDVEPNRHTFKIRPFTGITIQELDVEPRDALVSGVENRAVVIDPR